MLSARWWTLAVWALAAASAVFWGLRIFVQPPPVPPHARTVDTTTALRGDLSRLLGADAAPAASPTAETPEPQPDARFQLVGVVSPRSPQAAREGVAVIAIDGKAPRAFRIGAVVDGQNVLQSVEPRGATLGPPAGAALVALKLAPPAPAATGTLPSVDLSGRQPGSVAAPRRAIGLPPAPPPAAAQPAGEGMPDEAPHPAAPPSIPQPAPGNAQRM